MVKEWALIKDNKVVNKIVADDDFLLSIAKDYDEILDLTPYLCHPNIGAEYDAQTKEFHSPQAIVDYPATDLNAPHMTSGTEKTFKRFIIYGEAEKYVVKMKDDYVDIGCYRYKASWLRDAFYKILRLECPQIGPLRKTPSGVSHDGFYISDNNMELILQQLEKLKLC